MVGHHLRAADTIITAAIDELKIPAAPVFRMPSEPHDGFSIISPISEFYETRWRSRERVSYDTPAAGQAD